MIATDSTIVTSPSRIAGMNPAGLMARNSASFSTPASRFTGLSRYASPISSSSQTTRNPLPSPKTVIMFAIPSLASAQFNRSTAARNRNNAQARFSGAFRAPWTSSLPLNRSGRLARDVVNHPVDAAHFVDDAGRRAGQEAVLEGIIIRRHAIGGGDSAQGADMVVGT